MLTASLRLSGTLDNGAEVAWSYYLVTDFEGLSSGKPSIVPLSLNAPMTGDDQLTVEYDGEEAALKAAAEAIKALPGNRGLAMRMVINPE